MATGTAEAGVGGMPVLALVGHLALVNACKEGKGSARQRPVRQA